MTKPDEIASFSQFSVVSHMFCMPRTLWLDLWALKICQKQLIGGRNGQNYGTLKWAHRSNQSVFGIYNIWETTENWENEAISSGLVTRGLYFKKKRTLNGHFSRPAETDPYIIIIITIIKVRVGAMVDRKEGLISVPVVEHLLRTCGLPTNGQLPFINSPQPNWMNVSRGGKSYF